MARDGSVGKETFAQVEALVKQGKSKTEAFAEIAAETGRNAGTVSANYYRVARASGSSKPRRKRASTPARTVRPRTTRATASSSGSDIDGLASDLVESVSALAEAVKRQDAEVSALRNRLEGLRQAIG